MPLFAMYQIFKYQGVKFQLYQTFTKLDISKITNHSLRIGNASRCADAGMAENKTKFLGRCKLESFKSYLRPVKLL